MSNRVRAIFQMVVEVPDGVEVNDAAVEAAFKAAHGTVHYMGFETIEPWETDEL